jgi:hypothetical protein
MILMEQCEFRLELSKFDALIPYSFQLEFHKLIFIDQRNLYIFLLNNLRLKFFTNCLFDQVLNL